MPNKKVGCLPVQQNGIAVSSFDRDRAERPGDLCGNRLQSDFEVGRLPRRDRDSARNGLIAIIDQFDRMFPGAQAQGGCLLASLIARPSKKTYACLGVT